MVVIVSGVAGAGKTTVGRAAAAALGWAFYDADDFHSPGDIAQMARGERLTDEQRQPWLARIRSAIEGAIAAGQDAVIACSALRESYRQTLAAGLPDVRFVFLDIPEHHARTRVSSRSGHFAGPRLIDSQFAILEPPAGALRLDGTQPVDALVDQIRRWIG